MPAETQYNPGQYNKASAVQAVAAPSGSAAADSPPAEGVYAADSATALKAYQEAQASIQQRRSGIYQNYGFNQDGSVDGNNQVGQYQQLKHSQALELDSAQNQALSRHLGTHGLGAQVAEAPRFQEDVDSVNLGNSYLGALDSNSSELTGAGDAYQGALIDARNAQINDDIANGRFSAPDPTADATPGTRAKAAAAKHVAAKTKPYVQGSAGRGSTYAPKVTKSTPYRGRH